MKRHIKKQLTFIQIGLLLLTAIGTKVHARDKPQKEALLSNLREDTVIFTTILYSIDMSSCYTWLMNMNQSNAHKMVNALMAQLFKIVGLLTVASSKGNTHIKILFVVMSKLTIDSLAWLVRNTQIAAILSHWAIVFAVVHVYALRNINLKKKISKGMPMCYASSAMIFSIYYVVEKCILPLRNKIIGNQSQPSNIRYLFDIGLALGLPAVLLMFSEHFARWLLGTLPFVVLFLAYFNVNKKPTSSPTTQH